MFSNVTDLVAIIASNLRRFFGHEEPSERRISRYAFSKGISHCSQL